MAKNTCAKTRNLNKGEKPYEVWSNGAWTWQVLKKWQADDSKPYARWFCRVTSPYCPNGELGDTYVADIKGSAWLIEKDGEPVG